MTQVDAKLEKFYQQVQKNGQLPTAMHAQRWTKGVLQQLGLHLKSGGKKSLAKALPKTMADDFTSVWWFFNIHNNGMTSEEFRTRVGRRCGNTDVVFAATPILAVFGAVRSMIDANVDRQVSESLSPEIRELWQTAR